MAQFFSFPPEVYLAFYWMGQVWSRVWWIVSPIAAGILFWQFWMYYIQLEWAKTIKWILLEIRVPKDVLKTPKSMEQIFAAAHAPYSYGLRRTEMYWEGKMEYWMSFEMASVAGDLRFYIRLPKQFRNLMESAVYGQYPDAEVIEVAPEDDYARKLPAVLPDKTYDLFGASFHLRNPDPYPIRTYVDFEESVEERRVDPIAHLTELMSKLKADEQLWVQVMIQPSSEDWKKEGDALVNKILGREENSSKKKSAWSGLFENGLGISLDSAMMSPVVHPGLMEPKKKEAPAPQLKFPNLSYDQQLQVKAIESKCSKLGFISTVRYVYIDRRDSFSKDNVAAVMGFFRQFNTQNLNMFRPDKWTITSATKWPFKKQKLEIRKRQIYSKYIGLDFNPKTMILNIEELATIFHFPISEVKSPRLQRIESKTGGPPPTLPLV